MSSSFLTGSQRQRNVEVRRPWDATEMQVRLDQSAVLALLGMSCGLSLHGLGQFGLDEGDGARATSGL